jgi:thiamine pyrophosphate-dependent acetolactate synthase large subunit-like protein
MTSSPLVFPPRPTSLRGRRAELATLAAALRGSRPARLALVGTGGSGKSTLACALGHQVARDYPGGIHWFRVGAWDARTLIGMLAIRFGAGPSRSLPALRRRLRARGEMLIVLDNHEDDRAVAELLDTLRKEPVSWIITARRCLVAGVQIEVVGDIANSVWRLKQRLERQPHWDFTYFEKVREHLVGHLAEGADDERFPIYPQRLVAEVRKVMPADGIVCLDNGIYKLWFARYYRCRAPNTLLLDNALATMCAGLPSAIGAKIVFPERKVVAICGDGGFMMNSQELETAVRLGLNLAVLVLRDNAYGMIKWKQANMGFANHGMDMGNPDFVKYTDSYGARGHRPSSPGELGEVLGRALAEPGVDVIDVPIDYSDNDRILNREIRELSAKI